MSLRIVRPRVVSDSDGDGPSEAAWELVRRVRQAASELHPIVNEATAGLMDLYEEDASILDDPPLSRALTVMAAVLTSMETSIKILSWLEPPVVAIGGVDELSSDHVDRH